MDKGLFLDEVRREKERELESIHLELERLSSLSIENKLGFFSKSLHRDDNSEINIIGEVKPSSPSSNNFSRSNIDISNLVRQYQEGGVRAISVLTDKKYFSGGYDLLKEVSLNTELPILQKEFIIDPLQMKLGKACGASAVLLLTHYFSSRELGMMIDSAKEIGLEAVVEVSIEEELDRALNADPDIILVNNRPISLLPKNPTAEYLEGNVEFSRKLYAENKVLRDWKTRSGKLLISASCINSKADVDKIRDLPFDAILVGNKLSKSDDPKNVLQGLV